MLNYQRVPIFIIHRIYPTIGYPTFPWFGSSFPQPRIAMWVATDHWHTNAVAVQWNKTSWICWTATTWIIHVPHIESYRYLKYPEVVDFPSPYRYINHFYGVQVVDFPLGNKTKHRFRKSKSIPRYPIKTPNPDGSLSHSGAGCVFPQSYANSLWYFNIAMENHRIYRWFTY